MNKREDIPEKYVDVTETDWQLSRKKFIQLVMLSGVAAQLPWLQSCSGSEEEKIPADVSPLTLEEFKTVRALQLVLFPDDGNGPGARQINADTYFLWVMRDTWLDKDEQQTMVKRLGQFISACRQKMGSGFYELPAPQQMEFVQHVAGQDWGDKFLSRHITLILEALLLDPVYGGNTGKTGWKWLEHDPGRPRPQGKLVYPEIMKFHEV